jgi:uncharacterized RDD family membrane protein YckC
MRSYRTRAAEAPAAAVPASPWRRIAAGLYDLLPLAAILMIATALLFPFTRDGIPPGTYWYRAYLLLVAFAYYGLSWRRGGQTIGMKAWRLRMEPDAGGALAWPRVALRFAVAVVSIAAIGAGLFAALFDPRRRMWHDLAAGTSVVLEPKRR